MVYHDNGFLIPPWYEPEVPGQFDLDIACMICGFTLACGAFTFAKAATHSWKAYEKRKRKGCNAYIIMVWAVWIVCVIGSILTWSYLSPDVNVQPGFWVYFGLLVLWTIQTQCILQIIINRVRILMVDQRRADQIKWAAAIFVGLINISVFVIWIPARLQISQRWIRINNWWDRTEKVLVGALDISLNLYFIYTVRSKLIANGLKKYERLFRFNVMMIFVSMSLDITLIGMMSLSDSAVYIEFHPLVNLIKLHIEMNVAELIVKIVRVTNHLNECRSHTSNTVHPLKSEVTSSKESGSDSTRKLVMERDDALGNASEASDSSSGKRLTWLVYGSGLDLECGISHEDGWKDETVCHIEATLTKQHGLSDIGSDSDSDNDVEEGKSRTGLARSAS
ncbi:hypothetical protein BJ170DRAFT_75040 [Xylariales sp. AK1849]|nr:hypothetical protein BJ170DRAFT_75040 [Xylariales sp. AK1849]